MTSTSTISCRSLRKQPVTFVSITNNADHEENTPLRDYVGIINDIRSSFKAPPLTLYSSLLGPRIKSRFHVYDPLTETLHYCSFADEAEHFSRATSDERALLLQSLNDQVKRDLIQALRKKPIKPQFRDSPAPHVLYVHPSNLRRVQPPASLSHVESATSSPHDSSDADRSTSFLVAVRQVALHHPHLPDLVSQFLDPSNSWSLANLKSGILLIRFAKVLNRIRANKLGLPPYTVYWTAATRNKDLHNPRMGLVLWDPMLQKFLYTGSTYESDSDMGKPCCNDGVTPQEHIQQAATSAVTSRSERHQSSSCTPFVRRMLAYFDAAFDERRMMETEFEQDLQPLVEPTQPLQNSLSTHDRGPISLRIAYSREPHRNIDEWIVLKNNDGAEHSVCKVELWNCPR